MSKTKKYLIASGILLTLIVVGSLFKSNQYVVNVSVEINAPTNFVFNTINDLSYQEDWNAKASLDTSFHIDCDDHARGRGASCSYKSKLYGDGVIRILESTANDSLVMTEVSNKHATKLIRYILKDGGDNKSTVFVTGTSSSGWITNLWNFIHKWKLKKHLNHQLDNLQVFVQDRYINKIYSGYPIEQASLDQKFFLIQKAEINLPNTEAYYTQNISALYQTALDNKLIVSGMPCALYYSWDEALGKTEMAAAIPTLSELFIANTQTTHIPPGSALKTVYKGDKKDIRKAHQAIQDYMLDHHLQIIVPVIEEYVTTPTQEPDPSKWTTNIYYYYSEEQH